MRCEEARMLLEEDMPGDEVCNAVFEHVVSCAGCQEYAREWDRLKAGFRALAEDRVPEPSVGFAARLVRRLEESAARPGVFGADFLEVIGRRVVLAGLLLALTLLMAVVLPPSGPLRGPVTAQVSSAQEEVATVETVPIFGDPSGRPSAIQTVFAGEDDSRR